MLDSDLAELYGVETKVLNQAVKRNLERFSIDFMFQLDNLEIKILRSQIVTAKLNSMSRVNPYVFSENGVAMLSSILGSPQAIQVNIAIMRIFTKLRNYNFFERDFSERLCTLEDETYKTFQIVFSELEQVKDVIKTKQLERSRKIGLNQKT